jgi:hypothetical protein
MSTAKVARKRLTPHQREVFERIERQTRSPRGFARSEMIGSRGACQHLQEKGYITVTEVIGPRGGTTYTYQAVTP